MTDTETVPRQSWIDAAYANRELERKYEARFRRCFGVNLHNFWDIITGFDSIKFDKNFIGAFDLDGVSLKDVVQEKYGDEGVAIVMALLAMDGSGEVDGLAVLARGPIDIYEGIKPKFQHDGLLELLPKKYPQLEAKGAAWLVNLWEQEARSAIGNMPRNMRELDKRISTTKRWFNSRGDTYSKIKNRDRLFSLVNMKGR